MKIMVALTQAAAASSDGSIQKSIEPPSGGISPLAWVIICALAAAVVALGRVCLMLYSDLKKAREEQAGSLEDQVSTLKALRTGLDMNKPMTHVPPPTPPSSGQQGGSA